MRKAMKGAGSGRRERKTPKVAEARAPKLRGGWEIINVT